MRSAIPQGRLAEIVRAARDRTGVPAVAAGLVAGDELELVADGPVTVETPFRVASLTKWITASLAVTCLDVDAPTAAGPTPRALLSHTAGWRPESAEPLPAAAQGLWSYSNAGYWAVGDACSEALGVPYAEAVRERILAPLGMRASGFERPETAADGHLQEDETGQRPVVREHYPAQRHPGGGLWSTVEDMLRFASHQLGGPGPLSAEQRADLLVPQAAALGGSYACGVFRRPLVGGVEAFEHSGSVAGFQSLLLLVPAERLALVVLTNSWRGNSLIQRVLRELGLAPETTAERGGEPEPGAYALGDAEATVERVADGWRVSEAGTDPVTGARIQLPPYPVDPLGGGVYGFAGGYLMAHRVDFPRPGVARVGWVALPRAA
ncbi:MAG TPA: serine hydrolase domain-containing protein [Gaiellaceae bacterium]|nr:serine hydrolase domain-containing protein [Gaiellaceae bacterium]